MTFQQILFIIFGAITLGSALMVVMRRNVFHAALFMILSFFGVAGLYVLLEAPFLAGVQLFIYIGGISILIIFAIMLTRDMMNPALAGSNRQWIAAALVSLALCAVLVWTVVSHGGWAAANPGPVSEDSITILGRQLVDAEGLALPFEVASVLLLVALIGAVTIARER
jgi:NADH:ubiquinone oxidoreductase subunit 6 (subunit J)